MKKLYFFLSLAGMCLLPSAVSAENPQVSIDNDAKSVTITYNQSLENLDTNTIELSDKVRDVQAVSIKRDNKFYVVILAKRKKKVYLSVYTDKGEKLESKLIFRAKNERKYETIKLDVKKTDDATLYRARVIVTKKKGKPIRLLTKRYRIRPNKDTVIKKEDNRKKQIAFVEFGSGDTAEEEGLAMMNYFRMAMGQMPVKRTKELDEGCELHANYMRVNDTITHYEEEDKPGYTDEGELAGRQSDLAAMWKNDNMRPHIEIWIEAIYHRLPMKSRALETVGWGVAEESARNYNYSCLNVYGGAAGSSAMSERKTNTTIWDVRNHKPIPYPGRGQQNVPTRFDSGENPDPITAFDGEYPVGQPISLSFPSGDEVTDMSMKLKDSDGTVVTGYFRAPNDDTDPNEAYQGNTVTFIAENPLKSDEKYTVEVNGTRNGNEYSNSWKFRTAAPEFDSSKYNR